MRKNNYERMIRLADDVFAVKNDLSQLNVNEEVISRLLKMHPSTVSEFSDENGPVAWLLIIPTTHDFMEGFLEKKITEKEMFELTPMDAVYNALYLCSALVLEEYRRKGITTHLALGAIENIRKDHPIKYLFTWPFTAEGDLTAESIASKASLPLFKRK